MFKRILSTILLLGGMMLFIILLGAPASAQSAPETRSTATGSQAAVCDFSAVVAEVEASQADHFSYLPMVATANGTTMPPEPMRRELQYQAGKTYRYDYEISSYSSFGSIDVQNGVSPTDPNMTLSYGTAHISITAVEPQGVFVGRLVLENPIFCMESEEDPDTSIYDADIVAQLNTPLIFRQHKNGVIVDLQIAETVGPVAANQMRGILNSLQATLTEDDNYPIVEHGGQGSYVAEYTADLQEAGVQYTRTLNEDSFITFYSYGGRPDMTLNNTIRSFLDRDNGVFSEISFQETTTLITDPDQVDPATVSGVTLWGETFSSGRMELTAVTDTPAFRRIPLDMSAYSYADLGAEMGDTPSSLRGINIETVDIEAELDALDANPQDTGVFQRIGLLLDADAAREGTAVLEAIAARLPGSLTNDTLARTYIDLLGGDGSEYAQTVLANLTDPDNPEIGRVSGRLQEQAIINLALVERPYPVAVETMMQIETDPTGAVTTQNIATTALGAMVPALRKCDPAMAEEVYTGLKDRLAAATTAAETHNVLLALGNTEEADVLNVVQPYLADPHPQVQWAAYWALRDVPGDEAEELLLNAFNPNDLDPGYPLPAAAVTLKNRPGKPSDDVNQTLAGYYGDENPFPTPEGGTFDLDWNKEIGNDNLGGSFPGQIIWRTPPDTEYMEGRITQSINYQFNLTDLNNYQNSDTLADATVFTNPVADDLNLREFGYQYSIMGKSFGATYQTTCADSDTGTISAGKRDILHVDFGFPVFGVITVGVGVDATAAYSLDYEYGWDFCGISDVSGSGALLPSGRIDVTAYGYVSVFKVLRGGVEISAVVIDLYIPASLNASYSWTDGFESCLNIPIEWKALDITVSLFADRWSLFYRKWVKIGKKNLADTVVSNGSEILINNQCWSP